MRPIVAKPPAPEATTPPGGRGQKAQTQERIVSAAIAVFATRGYERASISAIATRARVSRSAVFWHFGDKEGLFREAFRRMLVPFFEELQASIEHIPPRQRIFEILSTYERVVDDNEVTIRSIVRWLVESETLRATLLDTLFPLHDALVHDVRDALAQIGSGPEESANLAAALVAALDGNLLLAMLDPSSRNRDQRRTGLRHLARLATGDDRG